MSSNKDIHQQTAEALFGEDMTITEAQRDIAKTINFGRLYGSMFAGKPIRLISGYEREIADKLKHTRRPYASRMSEFIMMPKVGDIQLLRSFSDCVIELEGIKEKLTNELVEYKQRYGNLENGN